MKRILIILGVVLMAGVPLLMASDQGNAGNITNMDMIATGDVELNAPEASAEAAIGVPGSALVTDYNMFFNPAVITHYTSGKIYFELGNKTGIMLFQQNNGQLRDQWGGVAYGGKYGSIGMFIGRPYSGIAQNTGNGAGNLWTGTNGIQPGVETAANGIGVYNIGADAAGANAGSFAAIYGVPTGLDNTAAVFAGANNDSSDVTLAPLIPEGKIDLLYGYKWDKYAVGLMMEIQSDKQTPVNWTYASTASATMNGDGNVINKQRSSDIGFTLGGNIKEIADVLKSLDISIRFNFPRVNNSITSELTSAAAGYTAAVMNKAKYVDTFKSSGKINVSAIIRPIVKLSESTDLIPRFAVVMNNVSSTRQVTVTTQAVTMLDIGDAYTNKTNIYALNIALNSKLSERTLFVVDLGANINVQKSKLVRTLTTAIGPNGTNMLALAGYAFPSRTGTIESDERNINTLSFPVALGIEHKLSGVLTGRLGIRKNVYQKTTTKTIDNDYLVGTTATTILTTAQTTTTNVYADTKQPATASIGLGINLTKDLTVDTVIQQDIFFTGGWVGSGIAQSLVTNISAKYRF